MRNVPLSLNEQKCDDEVHRGINWYHNSLARRKRDCEREKERERRMPHATNVLMRCKPVILTSHHEIANGKKVVPCAYLDVHSVSVKPR